MLYTLDTNVISHLLDGNSKILSNLKAALRANHKVTFNAISYYEIYRGLHLPSFQRKKKIFDSLVQQHSILPLNQVALDEAILIYQSLRKQGLLIEDADLLMGAIAISHNATLVTHNTKHFQRINNLALVDWQI